MNTSLKTCFKCGIQKERTQFYRHRCMADGLLGKCKECTKKDVQDRYNDPESRLKIARYERARFQTPHRKSRLLEYARNRRKRNPEKHRAHISVARALRTGRLIKQPCEVCGDVNVQGHHTDYSQPLNVQWLCFKHHREIGHGQKVISI